MDETSAQELRALPAPSVERLAVAFPAQVDDEAEPVPAALLWASIGAAYLVVHSPVDKAQALLTRLLGSMFAWLSPRVGRSPDDLVTFAIEEVVIPIKALLFVVAVAIIAAPLVKATLAHARGPERAALRPRLRRTALVFGLLSLLVVPFRGPNGLGSMGAGYGIMSLSPFSQETGWYYKRLLMPTLAHVFLLRGRILYYVFSLACSFALLFLILSFLERRTLQERGSLLAAASIATSSFFIGNFELPGYPEQLAFALVLLAAVVPLSAGGRLGVIVLALLSHEATVFLLAPSIWFCFPRRERVAALGAIALYFSLWLLSFGLDVPAAMSSHTLVAGISSVDYLRQHPWWAALGALMAYKLLWIPILGTSARLVRTGDVHAALAVLALTLAPLLALPLAVDTSRTVGFGFLGLLFATTAGLPASRRLLAANLVLPSGYVGLNTGVVFFPGLYGVGSLAVAAAQRLVPFFTP